ncbi:hypothetical protein NRD16_001237 [Photobacterium damselae]|nr:hypothetical protein [Photobacterium damselae]
MKLGKLALAMMVSTTLVGCGGGGSDEAPKPDVKPPVTTPDPDTKPPVDPEEPDTDNPVLPPVDPEDPDTEEPEVTPPPVIPEKPIFVDGEKCKAAFAPAHHDNQAFYCYTNSKEDALNFTNVKVNVFYGVAGPEEAMGLCTSVVEQPHNNEGLDGTPNAYYTTQACYAGEIVLTKPTLDNMKCEAMADQVTLGEFYYCAADTKDAEEYTTISGFKTQDDCSHDRVSQKTHEFTNGYCTSGSMRPEPVMTFGAAQALFNADGLKSATTLPSCTVNNEYLNVNIDPDYTINDCSPITDTDLYKVRYIQNVGDYTLAVVSSVYDLEGYNDPVIYLDTYLVTKDGKSKLLNTMTPSSYNMTVEEAIKQNVDMLKSQLQGSVRAPHTRMNATDDLVFLVLDYSFNGEPSLEITYVKPDLSLETKRFEMPENYSPDLAKVAVSERLIITTNYDKLVRGFDPMTSKPVILKINKGTELSGFNEAGNLITVFPDSSDMSTTLRVREYNSHGELVSEPDQLVSQNSHSVTYIHNLTVDNKITSSYDYPVDFTQGIIGIRQICFITGDQSVGISFGNGSGSYALPGKFVCSGYEYLPGGSSNFVSHFLTKDVTGDLKKAESKVIAFPEGMKLDITGTIGENLKAEDEFGSSYIIDSTNGAVLGESHFDDLIINK